MSAPVILLVFSYWVFYILRIVLSYFEIYLSITTFDAILIVSSFIFLALYYLNSERKIAVSQTNRLIIVTGVFVVISYIIPLVLSDDRLMHSMLFFIPAFPILFLITSILIPYNKKNSNFVSAKKLYLIIFGINLVVSLSQLFGTRYGLIGLDVFFYNDSLQAIIFPGSGANQDLLRIPGLFASGGANSYFNSILIIYLLFCRDGKRLTIPILTIIVVTVILVYFSMTRKVWVALFVTSLIFLLANAITASSLKQSVSRFFKLFIALLVSIFIVYYALDLSQESHQYLSSHSMNERLSSWSFYSEYLSSLDTSKLLFGVGYLQAFSDQMDMANMEYLIDNVYIALFFYAGLFGLILFSVFWIVIGVVMAKNYKASKFGFLMWVFFSIVSFVSTFFSDISTIMFAISVFAFTLPKKLKSETRLYDN